MRTIAVVLVILFSLSENLIAQNSYDSIRIKGFFIKPHSGKNYYKFRQSGCKMVTDFVFSDHTFYCYFLPKDSITGQKDWNYWLSNYKQLERNLYSATDQWIIEKRIRGELGKAVKIFSSGRNIHINRPSFEIREQNGEVEYNIEYIDAYWTKLRINIKEEGDFLNGGCCSTLAKMQKDFDAYIQRSVLESNDQVDISGQKVASVKD